MNLCILIFRTAAPFPASQMWQSRFVARCDLNKRFIHCGSGATYGSLSLSLAMSYQPGRARRRQGQQQVDHRCAESEPKYRWDVSVGSGQNLQKRADLCPCPGRSMLTIWPSLTKEWRRRRPPRCPGVAPRPGSGAAAGIAETSKPTYPSRQCLLTSHAVRLLSRRKTAAAPELLSRLSTAVARGVGRERPPGGGKLGTITIWPSAFKFLAPPRGAALGDFSPGEKWCW